MVDKSLSDKKEGCVVRSQMNTENAPKITQTAAKSVVAPNPDITPPGLPFPVSLDVPELDCDPLEVGFGLGTVPV